MRRILFTIPLFLLFAVTMLTPTGAQLVTADDNLITNPGFEGEYSHWLPQFTTAQMAPNWTPYWVNDPSHDPEWAMPEYKKAEGKFYPDRVYEGEAAQQWFNFHRSSYAGIYQQINNVTPGQTYRLSLFAQVWASSTDQARPSENPGDPNFRIGIDPTGAAHPGPVGGTPSTVVWSHIAPMDQVIDKWYQLSVDVTAENSTITVYFNASPQWALKHNDIYVDAANLVPVGTPKPTPPPSGGGGGDCVIPASGPWPPCATGGGGGSVPGNPGCVIPASGPWPPCATTGGGGTSVPGKPGCVIPASGPWPPCATTGGGGGGNPAPKPPAATPTPKPPSSGGNSGTLKLGGQTHDLSHPDLMLNNGLKWVKFQHKWSNGDGANNVAGRISDAHSRGFKVLMSIPGSDHNNIDFNAYASFLGAVAGLSDPPDAIEVWNEMNIDREWPSGQIGGAQYTNQMLKPAYNAIKAANSNVMVISGAPAPTGFFGGCSTQGCDDKPYIEAMAANGATDYMDCLGIHYNEGIISPHLRSGDPRGNSGHYTRYYWGMVDTYWNAIGGRRPLCFTELGYLSGEDYGGVPAGFSWAKDTSVGEHAQWLGEAVQLSKSAAQVDMLIIFNVDFTLYEPNGDPQAGYGMVRKNGSCPACDTVRNASGQ